MFPTLLQLNINPPHPTNVSAIQQILHLDDFEQFSAGHAQSQLQTLPYWLGVVFLVFLSGLFGMVYNYKNFLVTIMCVEVMYLGAVTSFVLYGLALREPSIILSGLLILIFGACESAVGLGLLVAVYRFDHKIDFEFFNLLGG